MDAERKMNMLGRQLDTPDAQAFLIHIKSIMDQAGADTIKVQTPIGPLFISLSQK